VLIAPAVSRYCTCFGGHQLLCSVGWHPSGSFACRALRFLSALCAHVVSPLLFSRLNLPNVSGNLSVVSPLFNLCEPLFVPPSFTQYILLCAAVCNDISTLTQGTCGNADPLLIRVYWVFCSGPTGVAPPQVPAQQRVVWGEQTRHGFKLSGVLLAGFSHLCGALKVSMFEESAFSPGSYRWGGLRCLVVGARGV